MELGNINFLAVFVAGIAAFVLGALWYSPLLFSKPWQKLLGFTEEHIKKGNMAVIMGTSVLMMMIMSFGMAILIQGHGNENVNWLSGLYHGLLIGGLFVATSIGINYLYQQRSFKLWLIDAFYQIIFLSIMGIILGAWK